MNRPLLGVPAGMEEDDVEWVMNNEISPVMMISVMTIVMMKDFLTVKTDLKISIFYRQRRGAS